MRAVITRVSSASVSVDGEVVGELPRPGLLVLAGVGRDDDAAAARTLAAKIWGLRILRDELSARDVDAPILVVSQFTLFASTRKGRRPGWSKAAPGSVSRAGHRGPRQRAGGPRRHRRARPFRRRHAGGVGQ